MVGWFKFVTREGIQFSQPKKCTSTGFVF